MSLDPLPGPVVDPSLFPSFVYLASCWFPHCELPFFSMSLEGGAHSPLLNFAAGESTSSSSSDVPRRVGTVLDEAAEEGPPEEQLRELASSPSCPSPASLLSSGRGNACDDGGLDGGASAEKHMVLSIPRRANGALNVSPVQLSDRSAQVSDRAPQHPPREEDEETVTEDEDEGEGGGPQEERGEGTNVTLAPIVDREEPNTSSRKRSNEESCSVGVGDEPASPTTAQERNIRARQDDIIIGDRIISPTSSSEKPNEETSPLIHSTKTAATSSSDPSVASASAPANQAPAAVPAAASAAFLRPHPAAAAAAAQYAAAAAAVNPFDPATAAAANAFGAAAAATAVVNPFATWNYAPTMTSSHPGSAMAAATLAAAQTLGGFRSAAPTPIGYVPVPVYYPAAAATVAQPVVHYPPGAATPYPVMSYSYPATTPTGASSPGVPTPSATVSATDVAAQRVPSTVAAPRLVANAPRQRRQRAKALPPSQLAESESLTKQASRRVAGAGAPENSGIGATTGDEFHKSMNRCVIREHVFPPTNWKYVLL
jgi:hypothetical protein